LIEAAEMAQVLTALPELKLVVLSVCHSAMPGGLAHTLANLNIPAVLGYRTRVQDRIAVRFSQTLYKNLLDRPIDQAVRDARLQLFGTNRELDWAIPVLYLRAIEPMLVPDAHYRDTVELDPAHIIPPTPPAPTPTTEAPPPPRVVAIENIFDNAKVRKVINIGDLRGAGVPAATDPSGGGIVNRFTGSEVGVDITVASAVLSTEEMRAFFEMIRELN
jgi:hypothetical protein